MSNIKSPRSLIPTRPWHTSVLGLAGLALIGMTALSASATASALPIPSTPALEVAKNLDINQSPNKHGDKSSGEKEARRLEAEYQRLAAEARKQSDLSAKAKIVVGQKDRALTAAQSEFVSANAGTDAARTERARVAVHVARAELNSANSALAAQQQATSAAQRRGLDAYKAWQEAEQRAKDSN